MKTYKVPGCVSVTAYRIVKAKSAADAITAALRGEGHIVIEPTEGPSGDWEIDDILDEEDPTHFVEEL